MDFEKFEKNIGFTLIEIMIVIGIIGTVMMMSIGSYGSVMRNSRDAQRQSDLKKIRAALEQYYVDHDTFNVTGGGWYNGGNGWVGYENGTSYATSVTRALRNQGYLTVPLIDDPIQSPGYMIYTCSGGQIFSLSATLENPTPEETEFARDHTCNGNGGNGTVTRYGKNYAITNQAL
ncbi:MAG: prepilin-type N-terminal cleavage/methylation domain-containing protein [Candidatus Roizmanbacteria bacterium]|nr:prepilin-type N-terminal cleavage/methylation domain-containing protein [Candidatus Roizmanbacteria bacterium]